MVSRFAARHYAVIWKQLLIANDRNSLCLVVLGLSQDGACKDLFENLNENILKGDLSNATTVNSPLFSLFNTFKHSFYKGNVNQHLKCPSPLQAQKILP